MGAPLSVPDYSVEEMGYRTRLSLASCFGILMGTKVAQRSGPSKFKVAGAWGVRTNPSEGNKNRVRNTGLTLTAFPCVNQQEVPRMLGFPLGERALARPGL